MLRWAALCAAAALGGGGCIQPAAPPAGRPARVLAGTFDGPALARAVVAETNRVRILHGVPPLTAAADLDAAADDQAAYMALRLREGHDNPFPGEHGVAERVGRESPREGRVAENALMLPAQRPPGEGERAYTYPELAAVLVDAWMRSDAHRANLLDRGFSCLGCAARLGRGFRPDDVRVFAAQLFWAPARRTSRPPVAHPMLGVGA